MVEVGILKSRILSMARIINDSYGFPGVSDRGTNPLPCIHKIQLGWLDVSEV